MDEILAIQLNIQNEETMRETDVQLVLQVKASIFIVGMHVDEILND